MILLVLAPLAMASAERPLARVDDALRTNRYWAAQGDGPVVPQWRNRRGTHQCWTWPDGIAEHCDRYDRRTIVETRHFDAGGRPVTTTIRTADGPQSVSVHGIAAADIDVRDWVEHPVDALRLRVPPGETDAWRIGDGTLRVAVVAAGGARVFDDSFLRDLRAWCACVVEDRSTAWIDAIAGVRYRVRHPHPNDPTVGEVWAVPRGDQVLLISFVAPGGSDLAAVERRLAGGRAVVALAAWAGEAP